jgi:hypothetical protein
MADRSIFGLLGVLAVVALIIFLMSPQQPGSTGERIRSSVQNQVHETADRLGKAWDAAKQDTQNIKNDMQNTQRPER